MRQQSGETKFSTLVWLALVAGLVYAAVKLIPPYVRDFQIGSTVRTAAKFYADPNQRRTLEKYLNTKIEDMKLPVTREDFIIEETPEGNVRVSLEWSYEVVWIPQNPVVEEYRRIIVFRHEETEPIKR